MITSFRVEIENEAFVREMSKERGLARVLNFLIAEYRENKGWKPPEMKIKELQEALKKKEMQYEALKDEVSK